MTPKEVCTKAARIAYPDLPTEAIDRIATAIWVASPTGELMHVQELFLLLESGRESEIAQLVKSLRNVETVAGEWK